MHISDLVMWLATPAGTIAMGWLFSTVVAGAPVPKASSIWYAWLYNTLQRIAANHSLTVGQAGK